MEQNEQSINAARRTQKGKKTKRRLFYAVASVLVFVVLAIFVSVKVLVVNSFEVKGISFYKEEDIIAGSGIELGQSLFSVKPGEVKALLEKNFPYTDSVSVERKLPDKIIINIKENQGSMMINIMGEKFALSDSLDVLSRISDGDKTARVELVNVDVKRCVVGEKLEYIDSDIDDMTPTVYAAIADEGLVERVSSIDLSDKFHIYISCEGRFKVHFGDTGDFDFKAKLLGEVLKSVAKDEKGEIDISDIKAAYVKFSGGI